MEEGHLCCFVNARMDSNGQPKWNLAGAKPYRRYVLHGVFIADWFWLPLVDAFRTFCLLPGSDGKELLLQIQQAPV